MSKPHETALAFYKSHCLITKISVYEDWVDDRCSKTYVTVENFKGLKKRMVEGTFNQLFELRLGGGGIARLKEDVQIQCREWLRDEEKNKRELAEYKRLKKKFEGVA